MIKIQLYTDETIYPMAKYSQLAQIDCRMEICKHYQNAECTNISPAISLNQNNSFNCWSFRKSGWTIKRWSFEEAKSSNYSNTWYDTFKKYFYKFRKNTFKM